MFAGRVLESIKNSDFPLAYELLCILLVKNIFVDPPYGGQHGGQGGRCKICGGKICPRDMISPGGPEGESVS